jgi:hypothetical protein
MTSIVRIRPMSEWPKDHVPICLEHAMETEAVEIECRPHHDPGSGFESCDAPRFTMLKRFTRDGRIVDTGGNGSVCGHVAEID